MKNFYHSNKIITDTSKLSNIDKNKMVFVSGVFDLLHIGHINFLRAAKDLVGDQGKLIVAIHADEAVKEHKGNNRPLIPLENRLDFLSELNCVDYIIPWYGWETITQLAYDLKPAYFAVTAKSYEHSAKNKWHGESWEEIAKRIHAQIVKIDVQQGISTTEFEKLLTEFSDEK